MPHPTHNPARKPAKNIIWRAPFVPLYSRPPLFTQSFSRSRVGVSAFAGLFPKKMLYYIYRRIHKGVSMMASHPFDSLYDDFFGSSRAKPAELRQTDHLQKQLDELSALNQELQQQLTRDGFSDLLPKKEEPKKGAPTGASGAAGFDGLLEELEQTVWGQTEFLRSLIRGFRRPFLLDPPADGPKNTLLLCGGRNTGRHFALTQLCTRLQQRGLLKNNRIDTLDLSLYRTPAEETLFYQDLYAVLQGDAPVLIWENYQACAPRFLEVIRDLVLTGRSRLPGRYVEQKGVLVSAGTALSRSPVSQITAGDRYFVFFSEKGPQELADRFGAPFLQGVPDICCTVSLSPQARQKIVNREMVALARQCREKLRLTLQRDETLTQDCLSHYRENSGAGELLQYRETLYRALSQLILTREIKPDTPLLLTVENGTLQATLPGEEPFPLLSLLPGVYQGDLQKIEEDLRDIVGLEPVKKTIFSLKELFAVQQRRRQEGLKTESPSMHMIFTGNPGTGKTTIARLTGRYLKAIGALSGGQLIEVSRADLVGRYVGHTAPLVNSVLRSALGGVLFIDEAYSLCRGEDDSFGLEAVDTLVKGMEDHRNELVVILAGYLDEMEAFLASNSGLASRFPHQIDFPDYTGEELLRIAEIQVKSKGYRMAPGCGEKLLPFFTRAQEENARENGNGRLARNVVETAIVRQAGRLMDDPEADLSLLLPEDFDLAQEEISE